MKNSERGQMLSEFLMCLSIAALLWVVLIHKDGEHNLHAKIKDAIAADNARVELSYPALNLSDFVVNNHP